MQTARRLFVGRQNTVLKLEYIITQIKLDNLIILMLILKHCKEFIKNIILVRVRMGGRPQVGSQSEILRSRKFNLDTLHQNLICYAAKNKHPFH